MFSKNNELEKVIKDYNPYIEEETDSYESWLLKESQQRQ